MTSPAAAGNGLFKFLRPKLRPQSTDIQAAAMWGVSAITGALYVIQPWDFLRKTFIEKQEEEK
ncbi:Ubiquinol-cytochrome c reductase complex 6.7 kDa protein [Capsicum annuum]|uniref:Ubiquinol-cytochrome c reductase complex 6.7 kDa protein n=1 Tax=Capsicum annuum TaxID=4072 RepID=A0A2G2ZWQ4_CAPAN|nr:Ubiquinol-cytochrome c reductase complex 6.7 kDa protein [Capsicum annuum]